MRLPLFTALFVLLAAACVLAQDGNPNIPTGTPPPTITCDPAKCIPPKCMCPSLNPPGNLNGSQVPQFVTVTFDDSIQDALLATALKMLNRKNPNGCPALGTWFVSMEYTDFSLVTQWYSQGHEIADHTFSHVGIPSNEEIASARTMLNTYGGVPRGKLQGFRAPFLNYSAKTLTQLGEQGFVYDSSASATTGDAYWPYTLDNGIVNDCWTGVCDKGLKVPGLWEIPMYSVMDSTGIAQLMDVYLAGTAENVNNWMQTNFNRHYTGARAPFGVYVHPAHLTVYPGLPDPTAYLNGVISFLTWAGSQQDVWFVTNQQLLAWMANPVPASQLASQSYMKCDVPAIGKEICNGLDDTKTGKIDSGLLNSCNLNTVNWYTCYNCPSTIPTVNTPIPPDAVSKGGAGYRYTVPDDCDTKWWDPIGNACMCNTTACAWKDSTPQFKLYNGTTNSTSNSSSPSKSSPSGSKSDGAQTRLGWNGMFVVLMTVLVAVVFH